MTTRHSLVFLATCLAMGISWSLTRSAEGVVDVAARLAQPREVAEVVEVSGRYAYVADTINEEVRSYDLSDPFFPRLAGRANGVALDMHVVGAVVYFVSISHGLRIIDFTDPSRPTEVGAIQIRASGVFVVGSYAFLVGVLDRPGLGSGSRLSVIDVSQPATPEFVTSLSLDGDSYPRIVVDGGVAYVLDDGSRGGPSSFLVTVDVSDPRSPRTLGRLDLGDEWLHDIDVAGGYAYVVSNLDLLVVDVTDPARPRPVARVPNAGDRAVDVDGDMAFVADFDAIRVFDIVAPDAPQELTFLSTGPGVPKTDAKDLFVQGERIYVANWLGGLVVLPRPTVPRLADLSVADVELTQAVQMPTNTVPLVADRRTIARVTVRVAGSGSVQGVGGVLRGWRAGVELPGSPLAPVNMGRRMAAHASPDRERWSDTLNFSVPDEWTRAGDVVFAAEVNHDRHVQERDYSNNRSGDIALQFQSRRPLEIVLIPIAWQRNGTGPIFRPTIGADNNFALGMLEQVYPISDVQATLHAEYYFAGDLTTNEGWGDLLGEIGQLRFHERPHEPPHGDPVVQPKYYGVVPVEGRGLWAGWGYIPGAASVGLVDQLDVAAHEMGHNFGLLHVGQCGGPAGPDPDFPYSDGFIGSVGVDTVALGTVTSDHRDIMAYCWPKWISDYHYTRLFEHLRPVGSVAHDAAPAMQQERSWLISGTIDSQGGSGKLNFAEPNSRAIPLPPGGTGRYRVIVRDSSGDVRYERSFDAVRIGSQSTEEPSRRDFAFGIPYLSDAAIIQLYDGQRHVAQLTASPQPPNVVASLIQTGEPDRFTIEWLVDNPNGANKRANVSYSPDGGPPWQELATHIEGNRFELDAGYVPGGVRGLVEVTVLNGTESASAVVSLGAVPDKAPNVGITRLPAMVLPNRPIELAATAVDLEDGMIVGDRLTWTVNAAVLGTGPVLQILEGLPIGRHVVNVTAVDSAGNFDSAETTLVVDTSRTAYLPSASR